MPLREQIKGIDLDGIIDLAMHNNHSLPQQLQLSYRSSQNKYTRPWPNSSLSHYCYDMFGYLKSVFGLFKDQIVVDLGSGKFPFSSKVVEASGAKGYVAVENSHYMQLYDNVKINMVKKIFPKKPDIPISIIANDMRDFLRKLPDNSVSVLALALDGAVLISEEYIHDLKSEIRRVKSHDGVFVCDGMSELLFNEYEPYSKGNIKAYKILDD